MKMTCRFFLTFGLVLMVLALSATPTLAHRLNVFAAVEGDKITGSAYFTGGARARGAEVELRNADGAVVARARTGEDGRFTLPLRGVEARLVVVDSGEGHIAKFEIQATELSRTEPSGPQTEPPSTATPDSAAIEVAVERAVARRVNPLREQIAAYEAKVRLHDVLGGIGYLAGLAGLGFWWLARRERKQDRS